MRWIKPLLFLAGLGLLTFIIAEIDLAETWRLLSGVGIGIFLILFIYFLAFLLYKNHVYKMRAINCYAKRFFRFSFF